MSPAKDEKFNENNVNSRPNRQFSARAGENESAPGMPIGTELTQACSPPVHGSLYYRLDCSQRREADPTKRLIIGLRMAMERDGATPAAIARQDRLMKPRHRVAAGRA